MGKNHKNILIWAAFYFVAVLLFSYFPFSSESNDAKYYADQVVRMQDEPIQNWIAPKWGENYWGFGPDSYVKDHLAGHLIMGLAFTKMGIPAHNAQTLLQMLLSLLMIFYLYRICRTLEWKNAEVLFWTLQLLPITFTYGTRANHEQGMSVFMFMAIYGYVRYLQSKNYHWLISLGAVGAFLIKGMMFVIIPLSFGLLSVLHTLFYKRKFFADVFYTAILPTIFVVAVGFVYEWWFKTVTNESFFDFYFQSQIMQRSIEASGDLPAVLQKVSNFGYYLSRVIIYGLPWSLFSIHFMLKKFPKVKDSTANLLMRFRAFLERNRTVFILATFGLVYMLVFSTSNRTASRYIFPVFYLGATLFIYVLSHNSVYFRLISQKIRYWGVHLFAASIWFLNVTIHLLAYLRKIM